MVSRTEIAVMSDERKVSIGRITSKRSRGRNGAAGGAGGERGTGRPDDGLITLHGRDSSLIGENFYEFQIHFPNRSASTLGCRSTRYWSRKNQEKDDTWMERLCAEAF